MAVGLGHAGSSTTIFTVIFARFVPIDTGGVPFAAFVCGIVAMEFLVLRLTDMSVSLVDNTGLVNKIYFPAKCSAGRYARRLSISRSDVASESWLWLRLPSPHVTRLSAAILEVLIRWSSVRVTLAALNVFCVTCARCSCSRCTSGSTLAGLLSDQCSSLGTSAAVRAQPARRHH
jgi:hypothetical protein